jgi:hypothetical protein
MNIVLPVFVVVALVNMMVCSNYDCDQTQAIRGTTTRCFKNLLAALVKQ